MFEGEIRWWILAQYTKRLLFCLDLTFPSGATEEKGKKKEWLKGFWEFLSCLPPDIVFACTYQTLGEMETKTNTYSTHADVYTQTYSCTKKKNILLGSLGLSCCLILIHLQN